MDPRGMLRVFKEPKSFLRMMYEALKISSIQRVPQSSESSSLDKQTKGLHIGGSFGFHILGLTLKCLEILVSQVN